jgi:glutaminase
MDVPARSGRNRGVSTGSAGPAADQGAVPPQLSRRSGQPAALTGAEAVYRKLFDSFDRDRDDKVSQWAVLSRLQGCGLLPDDPRIQEALAGLTATEGTSKQISFGQFKALARHNSSLIQRAIAGNLAVPDFPALTGDLDRMYAELLPVTSGSVADYIPQLRPDQ